MFVISSPFASLATIPRSRPFNLDNLLSAMLQCLATVEVVPKDCPHSSTRRLLKTREAASYLAVSPWKLRKLVQDSKLPYVSDNDGSPWRFDLRDLDSYIDHNRQNA